MRATLSIAFTTSPATETNELADSGQDPYLFRDATDGWKLEARKYLIKARPRDHKDFFIRPFYSEPEYCAACHKVNLDVPVNGYKWLRGQNEYDNWHDSGVSRNAARTFYLPDEARTCQDCHMPSYEAVHGDLAAKGGYVRGHEFLAANTALPHVRGDTETLEKVEKFLQDGKLRVEGLCRGDTPGWGGDGLPIQPARSPGRRRVDFPRGGSQSRGRPYLPWGHQRLQPGLDRVHRQGWLGERTAAQWGYWRGSLPRSHGSHLQRDHAGQAWQARDAARCPQLPCGGPGAGDSPGNVDIARYRVIAPEDGQVQVQARLLWRKFNRTYTEYSFQELGLEPPVLPITEIAGDQVSLGGVEAAERAPWVHYNDYGIGSLRQGDLKHALEAFARVAEVDPNRVDGYRNQARVHLVAGDPGPARELLDRCEEVLPGNSQTKLWWAEYLKLEGELEQAAEMYLGVLEDFPKDRNTWRRLADTYYRLSEYENSLKASLQALQIDPEDVAAHYQRMLIYRALGQEENEEQARLAFEKYRIDDNAFQLVKNWRLSDPIANREIETAPCSLEMLPNGKPLH